MKKSIWIIHFTKSNCWKIAELNDDWKKELFLEPENQIVNDHYLSLILLESRTIYSFDKLIIFIKECSEPLKFFLIERAFLLKSKSECENWISDWSYCHAMKKISNLFEERIKDFKTKLGLDNDCLDLKFPTHAFLSMMLDSSQISNEKREKCKWALKENLNELQRSDSGT